MPIFLLFPLHRRFFPGYLDYDCLTFFHRRRRKPFVIFVPWGIIYPNDDFLSQKSLQLNESGRINSPDFIKKLAIILKDIKNVYFTHATLNKTLNEEVRE